jgi:pyruvate formate lyase activating enzyme
MAEIYVYENKCTRCGKCAEVCPTGATTMEILPGSDEPIIKMDREKCIGCLKCVEACPAKARTGVGTKYSLDQLIKMAVADKLFFKNSGGGVTISGGEPLFFPELTLELAKGIKKEAVHVAVETSCVQKFDKIEPLLEFVDLFLVDIKTLNADKYREAIGGSLHLVLSNIEKLLLRGATVRIHLPIIPNFNDSDEDYQLYAEYLGRFADQLNGVDILPFHIYGENKYTLLGRSDRYRYKDSEDLPREKVLPLARELKKAGIKSLTIGGMVGVGEIEPACSEAQKESCG